MCVRVKASGILLIADLFFNFFLIVNDQPHSSEPIFVLILIKRVNSKMGVIL